MNLMLCSRSHYDFKHLPIKLKHYFILFWEYVESMILITLLLEIQAILWTNDL
jgi:hypothetical protein